MLSFLRRRSRASRGKLRSAPVNRCRLVLEALEERITPYCLSGYSWANPNVSASYVPDGTWTGGYQSNLFALYDASYSTATWQYQFARALQSWADVSPLNFHFVADDGSPGGTSGVTQGDTRFGDIRLGSTLGISVLGYTYYPSSATIGGDITLDGYSVDYIGSQPDLYSVLLHESGHAQGLCHSADTNAVMASVSNGMLNGLTADDIAGIQAIYGARQPDAYDAKASNDTLASATPLTLTSGAVTVNADLTSMADVDYYRLTVPSGSDGTLTLSVDARNLSLLSPMVSVYDSSGNLVATASASTYGSVATVNLTGLAAGQSYYVVADGATADVFGMGAYKLTVQFGGIAPAPAPTSAPDRYEVNDTIASATNFGTVSSVSQTGLTLHTSSDVDHYKLTAASKGTFTFSVTPSQGSGTLTLTVFNSQQTVLASGQSSTGGVSLSVSLASGQQYYVKGASSTGSLFMYDLSIGKSGSTGGRGGKGGALMLAPAPDAETTQVQRVSMIGTNGLGIEALLSTPVFSLLPGPVEQITPQQNTRKGDFTASAAAALARLQAHDLAVGFLANSQRDLLSGGGDDSAAADAFWVELAEASASDE